MDARRVAIEKVESPESLTGCPPPFHPSESYPELTGEAPLSRTPNVAFAALRALFVRLGLDQAHQGTREWNPLGWLVRPGDRVVLKPNFVVSEHPSGDDALRHTVTEGAVIRAIGEYVLLALMGEGELLIVDSPIKETDFHRLVRELGVDEVVDALRRSDGVSVGLVDLRDFVSSRSEGAPVGGSHRAGDPAGYVHFDLREKSALEPVSHLSASFRSTAGYYENRMSDTHAPGRHRYGVSRSVIDADVLINVPKLKTHCKAGITVALKNAVGICNEKRWLPHHRIGSPGKGGDIYRDGAGLQVRLAEAAKDALTTRRIGRLMYPPLMQAARVVRRVTGIDPRSAIRAADPYQNGGWFGNDTVWRMVVDLNRILVYGDGDGKLRDAPVGRRCFTVVDGIRAGEGNGPLKPRPKLAGVLIAGTSAPLVDLVSATLMGFEASRIPLVRESLSAGELPLTTGSADELEIVSNVAAWRSLDGLASRHLGFLPPDGWAGFIELEAPPEGPRPGSLPVGELADHQPSLE